jgi:GNAT superfamily N-acetyltransferase
MSTSEIEEQNTEFHRACRFYTRARERGELLESSGVFIACCGVEWQMFNAAFLSRPITDESEMGKRIATASAYFAERGLDWAFVICEDWLAGRLRPRAQALFSDYHLEPVWAVTGMLAERLAPPVRPLPELEFRRVEDGQTRAALVEVNAAAYRLPVLWFNEVLDLESLWGGEQVGYVGYVGGQPVTTAATLITDKAIGVFWVATLPGYEKRGYAETAMRRALEEARRASGLERTFLQATASGYPLYERMGYRPITKFVYYVPS